VRAFEPQLLWPKFFRRSRGRFHLMRSIVRLQSFPGSWNNVFSKLVGTDMRQNRFFVFYLHVPLLLGPEFLFFVDFLTSSSRYSLAFLLLFCILLLLLHVYLLKTLHNVQFVRHHANHWCLLPICLAPRRGSI